MTRRIAIAAIVILIPLPAFADEGMWRPDQLPALEDELRAAGLDLPAEQLADLHQWPMAAVISLGGCTASFVSPQGLAVTNHHCAYGSIQYNSDAAHNYLADGFLASGLSAELPAAPGSRIYVTQSMDDVTDRVLADVDASTPPRARYQAVEDARKALIAECEAPGGLRCDVAAYNGGEEYRLIARMEIRDVRLVYAPPESIGKFGGDIDNWMWPRHTGDFSLYRAYVGPDGRPADYSPDNVPYAPQTWLKVSAAGLDDGDFVMAAGYPGATSRYARRVEVEDAFGRFYPLRRRLYQGWADTILAASEGGAAARIAYAAQLASINNTIKNSDGQMEGATRVDLIGRRIAREAELDSWIAADAERTARYAEAVAGMDATFTASLPMQERQFWYTQITRPALLDAAQDLYRLARERRKPDAQREPGFQDRDLIFIRQDLEQIDRRFDADVDLAVWLYFLNEYRAAGPAARTPAYDAAIGLSPEEPSGDIAARLAQFYTQTALTDAAARLRWMEASPAEFEASEDPFIRLAIALYDADIEIEEEAKTLSGALLAQEPLYMQAITAWQESLGRPAYPDANSTLRVTYGNVAGSRPRDGMAYLPFTTLEGVAQKATGEPPFDAPRTQLDLIAARTYGDYALASIGSVPVNTLTTLDVTGGNSGSPILDADGDLVGLLFDGTYESINSDWDFAQDITRSIIVDSRYMLWTMQFVSGAGALIDEMELTR